MEPAATTNTFLLLILHVFTEELFYLGYFKDTVDSVDKNQFISLFLCLACLERSYLYQMETQINLLSTS